MVVLEAVVAEDLQMIPSSKLEVLEKEPENLVMLVEQAVELLRELQADS